MSDKTQKTHHSERRFGVIAVEEGFITQNQLLKAMSTQVIDDLDGRPHRLLGRILHEEGAMTLAQIGRVLLILGMTKHALGP